MRVPVSVRVAAVLVWISAVGLGVPCVMAIRNLSVGQGIPYVLGFPAYGGGAFEKRGLPTTIPLLVGFLLICLAEAIAGGLLWRGRRSGGVLGLALLIPGAVYWWGFDLPYPPVMAVVRAVLIVRRWSALV